MFPEKVNMDSLGYYQTANDNYDDVFVNAVKALNRKTANVKTETI